MALQLTISCSHHQKDGWGREEAISLDTIDDNTRKRIERHLKSKGWVVEYNGEHMDTYCSKECAK